MINETISMPEAFRKSWTRSFTETVQAVETQVHLSVMLRYITESTNMSESIIH